MATHDLSERLRRTRHRLRRRLLRHRRGLAAVLLGVAAVGTLRTLAPAPPAYVDLVVAAADLPAGTPVSASDLTVVRVPPDAVPEGAQGRREALGRTLAGPLRRGEPLTDAGLVAPGMLTDAPGMVALPVRIPDPGVVAMLRPGDRIDLAATDPQSGLTEQVATGVRVITVPQPEREPQATGPGLAGRLVVLAVSPASARNIAGAAATRWLAVTISG
ncbi:Flp pilus assembly protein CpaB [Nocardioides daejeonensis]|uniref:Flp pilus assembly protein CpaB n=1 Tax=Nocardioides daejeonensis TaxID=1046556 RepID=UPI000D7500E2|nr:Flp pilus assembly protein CpaB [Nocardioides daejeonensis]